MDPTPDQIPPPDLHPSNLGNRLMLRLGFWVLFLTGPFIAILLSTPAAKDRAAALPPALRQLALSWLNSPVAVVLVLVTSAAGAALCLVKLHVRPRTTLAFFVTSAAFTLMVLGIWIVIALATAFVGCLLFMGK